MPTTQIFDGTSTQLNVMGLPIGLGVGTDPQLAFGQIPNPTSTPAQALSPDAGLATVRSDFIGAGTQTGYAGYANFAFNPAPMGAPIPIPTAGVVTLDRSTGFRVTVNAQVVDEASGPNRSGFSFIVLGSDARGVEISFEGETAGNSTDDFLFAQQEGFDSETAEQTTPGLFDITQSQDYALTILGNTYSLTVNGIERLTGAVKLYDFTSIASQPMLPTDPYRINNLLFFGDDTDTGKSTYTLGAIAVSTLDGAPLASGVNITGTASINQTLTGTYTYADPNSDPEQGSTFQWFRADSAAGTGRTAIAGATDSTYTATADDAGKFLFFEVTPRDNGGTTGAPIVSGATAAVSGTTPAIAPPAPTPAPAPIPDPVPTSTAPNLTLPEFPETATPVDSPATDAADSLTGSDTPDIALGFAGDDTLTGNGGDDFLFGWTGDDRIDGGSGNDFARGGSGDDLIYGDQGINDPTTALGDDTLDGGAGNDTLYGDGEILSETGGNDILCGGTGNDVLFGQKGNDTLCGDAGDDSLNGGADNDLLFGGTGDDIIAGDLGDDTLIGNDGSDTFVVGDGTDIIQDFIQGTDVIDLPDGIGFDDLQINYPGNQAILFISGQFSTTLENFGGVLGAGDFR